MDHSKAYDDTVPIAVQTQENKRRKRRILKIAVYFVFGVVALGVFAVWLLHRDTVESLHFGSGFTFTVKLRSLEIKNNKGDSVLYGDMGRTLLATPYEHCWDDTFQKYEESCLYWRDIARLRVTRDDNSTSSCYTFQWEGIKSDFIAEDCFYLQNYNWYGYLTNTTPQWPISGVRLDGIDYYVEYPREQRDHLVPVWFGSQGVAIFMDSNCPFTFTWNVTDRCQLCFTSKAKPRDISETVSLLRYTVCHGESIKDVYKVSRQHRLDVDRYFAFEQTYANLLVSQPIYSLSTKEDMTGMLNLVSSNESTCSFIELFDNWQGEYGNLSIDLDLVESIQTLLSEAALHDCHPVLPISTFFSYKSQYYRDGVRNNYFIRDGQNLVTKMIQWRGLEGTVLDVTNPKAYQWFLNHIRGLMKQLSVKALKLLHVTVPHDSRYFDWNMTHLDYTRIFYKDMAALNISLILDLATGFIPLPVYVPIRMKFFKESDSYCLNMSIPNSLMMGFSGFPLLVAATDISASNSTSEEMFKLWLHVAIFFPIFEIPNIHLLQNKEMQIFLQEALSIRSRELLPYLTKVWEKEPELPIIRPLWWIAPNDAKAQVINDQFLVGDRMLVAPVLCEMAETRFVYLPEGIWRKSDNSSVQGPQTIEINIYNFSFIPYFWKEEKIGAER